MALSIKGKGYGCLYLHVCISIKCMCVCVCVCVFKIWKIVKKFSHSQLFGTPWTVAPPVPWTGPLSMGFPGKNPGVGCHFSSRGSSWLRNPTWLSSLSCTGRRLLYHWATGEVKKLMTEVAFFSENYSRAGWLVNNFLKFVVNVVLKKLTSIMHEPIFANFYPSWRRHAKNMP